MRLFIYLFVCLSVFVGTIKKLIFDTTINFGQYISIESNEIYLIVCFSRTTVTYYIHHSRHKTKLLELSLLCACAEKLSFRFQACKSFIINFSFILNSEYFTCGEPKNQILMKTKIFRSNEQIRKNG